MKDPSRRKLIKLLGKKLQYSAIFLKSKDKSALLIDVSHKGKIYTDHIWVSYSSVLEKLNCKAKIIFFATAKTYIDSYGVRKYGLDKCHSYQEDKGVYDVIEHNKNQRNKRMKK